MNAPDSQDHWLARPATIRLLWRVFAAVLALTVLAQAVIYVKGYFGMDGWFAFGAIFGFLSCLAMVLVAKGLGYVLKRGEDYYDDGAAMFEFLPPALILLFGSLLIGPTRGIIRSAVVLITPLLTMWAVWQVPDGVVLEVPFLDYVIQPIEGSPVRRLFATIFALMAFVGGLYSFRQAKWYELAAAYAYGAGAIGVSFAGDLISLFLFWELMALFSTVVVWCGGTPAARAAGIRYAIMHLLGGVILKVGIEGVVVHTGSIEIQPMLATNFDTWMMLIGILINAAAPPVSAWLSDSYPNVEPDRLRVPVGLHDQDRCHRPDPAVPGRARADRYRPVHGDVRHHLCAARE